MSRTKGSASRSPYRSPARLYETEREAIIEDEIRLKSALRAETDARRMSDQIALLQTRLRQLGELEDRCDSFAKQNALLARENDDLARQLNERRYQIERLRSNTADLQERDAIKNGQLLEVNKSLELQVEILKKERVQSNRLFESHIEKLERMLDEKVRELDTSALRCSDLSKELQLAEIRFEEERNRLRNAMNRTQHELQREIEYTREKATGEKLNQIDSLKRNHASQCALLEDELAKLKALNVAKTQEFESQLADNRQLRQRHEEEVRALAAENDELRSRMLKLEDLNRTEVQNIQAKYSDYHQQGTSSLKEQHGRELKILLEEVDKLKWLLDEKNQEIQNLVREKRDLRRQVDDQELELGAEIDTLKNKLQTQQEANTSDSHSQMSRINELTEKLQRDAENYHNRAKDFRNKIARLEADLDDKQAELDRTKGAADLREKEILKTLAEANTELNKVKAQLYDSEDQRARAEKRHNQIQANLEAEIRQTNRLLNEARVKLEETQDRLRRLSEESSGNEDLLKIEVDSLRKTIAVLEERLIEEQRKHSKQMEELSSKLNEKVAGLQQTQRNALRQNELSRKQEVEIITLRVEKALREKEEMEQELKRYIAMYENLNKYFKNPHDGALFEEKSQDSIYQVLSKTTQSHIHIF